MNISKYVTKTHSIFCISGMFAGDWMWHNTRPRFQNCDLYFMKPPLCSISQNIEGLTKSICSEVRNIPDQVTLVGNSLGAYIALDVASKIPDKIENIVISGSAGFAPVSFAQDKEMPISNRKRLGEHIARLICFDESKLTDFMIQNIISTFNDHFVTILRLAAESNGVDIGNVLNKIHCPMHAIWGENDVFTPFYTASDMLNKYNISYEIIKDCGHSPMFEKPDEFADLFNKEMSNKGLFSDFKQVA